MGSGRNEIIISGRRIGHSYKPLVIAEAGINHDGNIAKAYRMVDDAHRAGCECIKFQCHIIEDEMVPNKVIPGNAKESIWDMMKRCQLSEDEEIKLKKYVESRGMIYLSTPFSRAAADRLKRMGIVAYKIGSGECNNFPLIEHIARYKKPVILSTGMNDINCIKKSVLLLRKHKVPFALLHCTSIYPTPYGKVRLNALVELKRHFPDVVLGLSDHSLSIYPCLGAVSLGACIIEKHFTSNKNWHGADIPISMNPKELSRLIEGSRVIHESLKGAKGILKEEKPTIRFAYACVVAIKDISAGEKISLNNVWVKRPGTGQIKAEKLYDVLGNKAKCNIKNNTQIKWSHIR